MFDPLFTQLRRTPAAQTLLRRVEAGGALTCGGVTGASHAFVAAWLHQEFPSRPIVLVAEHLKAQETLHQDLGTWLGMSGQRSAVSGQQGAAADPIPHSLLFFPAWETLPHEDKLPHADVISERLETLVALMANAEWRMANPPTGARRKDSTFAIRNSPLLTTSITALLQRTFAPVLLATRTRTLRRGERVDPLDLIEWLEDMGYDSEAQVSAKGDIALRGGIVDVFPLTSPWPVRLEFFGDELESLRTFDPVTQISREGGGLEEIVLPPAGELGVLKRMHSVVAGSSLRLEAEAAEVKRNLKVATTEHFATLLNYLPDETIVILCEPEAIERHAEDYGELVPDGDPFFTTWDELRGELLRRGLTVLALMEEEALEQGGEEARLCSDDPLAADARPLTPALSPDGGEGEEGASWQVGRIEDAAPHSSLFTLHSSLTLSSLDAFRPITQQLPTQEVALALRREFFLQLLRWMRQGFNVQVLCNNDGEAQRFGELWREMGDGERERALGGETRGEDANRLEERQRASALPSISPTVSLGSLARGFLCEAAKLAVVTDAEIFGRYKVQRPRRMKSAHAIAARSAMDIDFSELEEGDYVVHLQHGIGRFKGLRALPSTDKSEIGNRKSNASSSNTPRPIPTASRPSSTSPSPRRTLSVNMWARASCGRR